MIRQYLSNKNESATVAKFEFFSELNKALYYELGNKKAAIQGFTLFLVQHIRVD